MGYIKKTIRYIVTHKALALLILVAAIITLMPFVFDGTWGCVGANCGYIIGTNYRDGLWFLAVAQSSFLTSPFQIPNYSGLPLSGYHFLPNLVGFLLSKTGVPITFTYFQIFPIVYFILLTLLLINLARSIKDDNRFVFIFLFFGYFGIPFTIITSLYHYGTLRNGMLINTFQTTRILESIHAAYAYLITLGVLIIYRKKIMDKKRIIAIGFLLFIMMGIKIYAEALLIAFVALYETILIFQTKKIAPYLVKGFWYFVCVMAGVFLFYNPFTLLQSATPVFTFAPFATVNHIIESPDLFYMKNLVLARYLLIEHGISPRLIAIELFSLFLYIFFYFGTRIIGFVAIGKQFLTRKISIWETAATGAIILGIVLAVTLIQRGDWYNPMQFSVFSALLINSFAALLVYQLIKHKSVVLKIIGFFVLAVMIPSNLVNLGYLQNPNRFVISKPEIAALTFLKEQPNNPVFVPIVDPDAPYVSAFSGKPTYFNFVSMVETSGLPVEEREKQITNLDTIDFTKLPVTYVYIPNNFPDHAKLEQKIFQTTPFHEIFRNSEIVIFEK